MTLIKNRLGIDPVIRPGVTGQFEVIADGEMITQRGGNWLTRKFGAGYPDLDGVVEQLEKHRSKGADLSNPPLRIGEHTLRPLISCALPPHAPQRDSPVRFRWFILLSEAPKFNEEFRFLSLASKPTIQSYVDPVNLAEDLLADFVLQKTNRDAPRAGEGWSSSSPLFSPQL